MQFVPYRLIRNEPSALRQKLEDEGELIITLDGKPFAVMIDLSENEDIEDILLFVSRIRAQMAARAIRSQARRAGLDQLSEAQIEDIIQKSRSKQQDK